MANNISKQIETYEIAIKNVIKRVYEKKIEEAKKKKDSRLLQAIELIDLEEVIKTATENILKALKKTKMSNKKLDKMLTELAEKIINSRVNKKIEEITINEKIEVINGIFRETYEQIIKELKKNLDDTRLEAAELIREEGLEELIKVTTKRIIEKKMKLNVEKVEKMIRTAINKKARELNPRTHTDDLIEEFMEAGLTLEYSEELAYRYLDEKLFDKTVQEVAEEFMQERPNYKKLSKENNRDRVYNIGCDWKGTMDVVEYENDRIYVPSSRHCIIKCYEKLLNRKINATGIHKYAATLREYKVVSSKI